MIRATKKIYILTRVVRNKNSERNKNPSPPPPPPPPCKLDVRSLTNYLIRYCCRFYVTCKGLIRDRVVVFNSTFNNISVISLRSVFLMEENRSTRRKPPTCCKSRDKLYQSYRVHLALNEVRPQNVSGDRH